MAEIVIKLVNGELAGKTAQTIAKEVNAAALALKKAEIGTKEWVAANEKLTSAKALQGDLRKQIEGTAKASDMLKNAWNKLPGAQFFNQISESFGMARQGVGGLISSMGMLKGAIAATGIGALVLVIASLVSWFVKTDEGATKLDGIMRAIGNTVDVLMNRLINLKQSLLTLFTNPGQFFRGLVSDIKEGIDLGNELAETFDTLDQARRDMELVDAGQSVQINKLLLQSKNVALSYAERLAILEKVDAMERENYQTKLKYALDFAAAVTKETEFMEKNGTITDEQLDKQNEARIKLLAVQEESIVLQEKIDNRRSQLLEKQKAELEKDSADRAKIWEREKKELLEQEKFIEERSEKDIQIATENRDKKAGLSMNAAAASLAERILFNRLGTAEDRKAYTEREAALQAHLDLVEKNEERARERMLQTTIALSSDILNFRINESKARLDVLRAQHGEESNIYRDAARIEGERIKQNEKNKVKLNLIAELSSIWKGAAAFGPLASIVAALQTGAAIIRAGAAERNINRMKFEQGGGVLNGPRHAQGGIPIEAEGGEFIFSRKAVRALGAGTLNRLNSAYTFANGGPVSPFGNAGGSSAPRAGGAPSGDPLGANDLKNAFINFADEVRDWQRNLQVTNNLQETQKGLGVLNELKSMADV